jgi:hypothetical protein
MTRDDDNRASAIEARRAETRSGSGEAESAARRETPEHRARQTYELLISDPHRPGALATLTEAFRACENDALERAATAAHSAIFDKNQRDPSTPASDYSAAATDAIRALKHKEPS